MKDMKEYFRVVWSNGSIGVLHAYWFNGVSIHDERAYCGNVFKTYEEADANKYDVYERLTGKKWRAKRSDK